MLLLLQPLFFSQSLALKGFFSVNHRVIFIITHPCAHTHTHQRAHPGVSVNVEQGHVMVVFYKERKGAVPPTDKKQVVSDSKKAEQVSLALLIV